MDNNDTPQQDPKSIGRKVYEWLISVGVPAVLAAGLVAAAYGLLVYFGMITLTSCTVSYTKLPDGTVSAQGAVAKPVHVTK